MTFDLFDHENLASRIFNPLTLPRAPFPKDADIDVTETEHFKGLERLLQSLQPPSNNPYDSIAFNYILKWMAGSLWTRQTEQTDTPKMNLDAIGFKEVVEDLNENDINCLYQYFFDNETTWLLLKEEFKKPSVPYVEEVEYFVKEENQSERLLSATLISIIAAQLHATVVLQHERIKIFMDTNKDQVNNI